MFKRVFLIVLDGLGIGGTKDSYKYGDDRANTLLHVIGDNYNLDVLKKLGLTKLIGINEENTRGLYMRCTPYNPQKDSLNSHYEIMGEKTKNPYSC